MSCHLCESCCPSCCDCQSMGYDAGVAKQDKETAELLAEVTELRRQLKEAQDENFNLRCEVSEANSRW